MARKRQEKDSDTAPSRRLTKEERAEVEKRVAEIADANDGVATPENLVEDGRDPDSPLHDLFDWDNEIAGHKHRVNQARSILREIRVQVTTHRQAIDTPVYIHDPSADTGVQGYVEVASLREDQERAREALENEMKQLLALLRRAQSIAAVLDLEDEFEEMVKSAMGLKAQVEAAWIPSDSPQPTA